MNQTSIKVPAAELRDGDVLAGTHGAKDRRIERVHARKGAVHLDFGRKGAARPILKPDHVVRIRPRGEDR